MPPVILLVIAIVAIVCVMLPYVCGDQCRDVKEDTATTTTNPATTVATARSTTTTTTTTNRNNISNTNYNYTNDRIRIQRLPSVSDQIILATDVVRVTSGISRTNDHKFEETDGTVILVHMEPTTRTTDTPRTPMEC